MACYIFRSHPEFSEATPRYVFPTWDAPDTMQYQRRNLSILHTKPILKPLNYLSDLFIPFKLIFKLTLP